jgi:hypothetical protein
VTKAFRIGIFVFGLQLACLASPAWAMPVDLELVLAVDVSPSVDDFEAAQQRNGYLGALTHPAVISAVQSGLFGRIAITYVEWAGQDYQRTVVDWTLIQDGDSARSFADKIAAQPITNWPSTSISGVIDFARQRFENNGYESQRHVIDISGDGPNSSGRPVEQARNEAVAAGITINGLPVFNRCLRSHYPSKADPRDCGQQTARCLTVQFGNENAIVVWPERERASLDFGAWMQGTYDGALLARSKAPRVPLKMNFVISTTYGNDHFVCCRPRA